jgi:hypothetical protein
MPARIRLIQHGEDRRHQGARRFGTELDRNSGAGSLSLINKVDV